MCGCVIYDNTTRTTMLQLSVKALMISKGMAPTATTLMRWGIPQRAAYNIINNTGKVLSMQHLYELCARLCCTPNDIIVYAPDPNDPIAPQHPLHTLQAEDTPILVADALKQMMPHEIAQLTAYSMQVFAARESFGK
jgi:DNA-binding Xre family transcriptional regulator